MPTDFDWLLTEPLFVTPLEDPDGAVRALVSDAGRRWAGIVRCELLGSGLRVTVNGEFYDFGEDFSVVVGLLDEVAELPKGAEAYVEAAEVS